MPPCNAAPGAWSTAADPGTVTAPLLGGTVSADLAWVIAATTQWLVRAYPAPGGALAGTLAEVQARQAVTVAAWLRYPTAMDAGLLGVVGPGGSGRLGRTTPVPRPCELSPARATMTICGPATAPTSDI